MESEQSDITEEIVTVTHKDGASFIGVLDTIIDDGAASVRILDPLYYQTFASEDPKEISRMAFSRPVWGNPSFAVFPLRDRLILGASTELSNLYREAREKFRPVMVRLKASYHQN